MGYRIEYPGKQGKQQKNTHCWIPAVLIFGGIVLVSAFWPRGRWYLQRLIFPGDATRAIAELECFAQRLQEGMPFSNSLEAFCLGILRP